MKLLLLLFTLATLLAAGIITLVAWTYDPGQTNPRWWKET
jgi:hypothetical protein